MPDTVSRTFTPEMKMFLVTKVSSGMTMSQAHKLFTREFGVQVSPKSVYGHYIFRGPPTRPPHAWRCPMCSPRNVDGKVARIGLGWPVVSVPPLWSMVLPTVRQPWEGKKTNKKRVTCFRLNCMKPPALNPLAMHWLLSPCEGRSA